LLRVNKDQLANRKKKGSSGGRPYAFDTERYKQRHAVKPQTPWCGGTLAAPPPRMLAVLPR
jgi:hypothetical protein